jgi:hypothetical protein
MDAKRKLQSHKINELNESIEIAVMDDPGHGNACHHYKIIVPPETPIDNVKILFQNGGIAEHGVNGISNEALLAIVEDRLLGFQSGPFPSRESAIALTKIQEAMMWLHKRTRDRISRGVEGKHLQ